MVNRNRQELIKHIEELDVAITSIYNELMGQEDISLLKLKMYSDKMNDFYVDLMNTILTITKKSKRETLLLKLVLVFDVLLTIAGILLGLKNVFLSFGFMTAGVVTSGYTLTHLTKSTKFDKDNKETIERLPYKLLNTIKSCENQIYKRINIKKENDSDKYVQNVCEAELINEIIQSYIMNPKNINIPDYAKEKLILIIQKEFATNETDVYKLLEMARMPKIDDVLILNRKKQQNICYNNKRNRGII